MHCAPYFILLLHKLVKAAQTNTILSNIGFIKRGITPERILNCFNFKMFLSTRVRKEATRRVCVVPFTDRCAPLQQAGETGYSLLNVRRSQIRKPLSAVTASPS